MAERAHPEDKSFVGTIYEERLRERYAFCNAFLADRDVLDVPCGTGWGSSLLSGYRSLTGIDIDLPSIEYARRNYPGIRFREGSMTKLAFEDATLDVVICLEGLEHVYLSDAKLFLAEVHRVLRPNGMLIVTAPLLTHGKHSGNPYHHYEFEATQLQAILEQYFTTDTFEIFDGGDSSEARFVGLRRAIPTDTQIDPLIAGNQDVAAWLTTIKTKDGFGYTAGAPTSLIATACAILTLQGLGRLSEVNAAERQQWIDYLRGCQDTSTGLFLDPLLQEYPVSSIKHDEEYLQLQMSYFALIALEALGTNPQHSLLYLQHFNDRETLLGWLDKLDWANPWLESNRVMFVLASFIFQAEHNNDRHMVRLFHDVLDWLDTHQDPATGLWGTDHGASALNAMAGAFHFFPFYEYVRRPITGLNQVIDITLGLQQADGMFGAGLGGGACEDLDAVDVLAVALLHTSHRSEEVKHALVRAYWAIQNSQNRDGGYSYQVGKHESYSFSTWAPLSAQLDQSDAWATWVRLVTLSTISMHLPDDLPRRGWHFHRTPALGYHQFSKTLPDHDYERLVFWQRELPPPQDISADTPVAASIIIPCYNLGLYLYEAVASAIRQTTEPVEIIIIDDGSTDDYTKLVLGHIQHPQVRVVRQSNAGLPVARNIGIAEAKADILCCLDADDRIRPTFVEKAVAILTNSNRVGFVSCHYREFDTRNSQIQYDHCDLPEMLWQNRAIVSSVFRREAWQAAGRYCETMTGLHDWDIWVGMLEAGYHGHIIPEVLFEYRVRAASMYTVSSKPENYARLVRHIVERHSTLYQQWMPQVISGWASEFANIVAYAQGQAQLVQQLQNVQETAAAQEYTAYLERQIQGLSEEISNWKQIAEDRADWITQLVAARDFYRSQSENWQAATEEEQRYRYVIEKQRDTLELRVNQTLEASVLARIRRRFAARKQKITSRSS
jgi:glycosyltransferase involved in cell wall biosynthesis/SAM-dependent methyltransferase